jgi:signal transduction histidine kinase
VRLALEDIERDDRHAGRIIQRLRAFINRSEVRRDLVDVNEIGREVLRLVGAEAERRGVMTISRLAPDAPQVLGDRVALQQVLLNLVLNALDAAQQAPPGDRQVTVGSLREPNGAVAVTVTDTGPGVAPQQLGRLFEPFFTTKVGGIGLGLSLSRSLVEAHGGQVWAEPNPSGGMTFGFRIPIAVKVKEAEA